jgi:hypothetical protein
MRTNSWERLWKPRSSLAIECSRVKRTAGKLPRTQADSSPHRQIQTTAMQLRKPSCASARVDESFESSALAGGLRVRQGPDARHDKGVAARTPESVSLIGSSGPRPAG